MTALPDVSSHAIARARWRPGEIAFWILALACAFLFPSRYLIMTDIVRLALFALSLDLILGYAGIVSLGHAAFFGVGAYSRRAAGAARHHQRAGDRAGRGRPRRHGARLSHQFPGDPRRRPDPADGDARHRAAAGSAGRTLLQHHRRHRRAAGHRDAADPRPVCVRHVRQDRLLLLADRAVPAVPAGAADRAFAVRPVAARDQEQSAAGVRDRHARQPPPDRDLHAGGVLCRHRRRAVHPDHGAGLARRVLVRALGRSDAGAGDRRHRLSLWRPDRRGRVQDAAGVVLDHHAAILAVLDRARAGRDRAGRPRRACIAGRCGCPTSSSGNSPDARPSLPFPKATRHDDRAGNQRAGKILRRPARSRATCRCGSSRAPATP